LALENSGTIYFSSLFSDASTFTPPSRRLPEASRSAAGAPFFVDRLQSVFYFITFNRALTLNGSATPKTIIHQGLTLVL
jgi:hypothetical protein